MRRRGWIALLFTASSVFAQSPLPPALSGVWTVTDVPFGPWKFGLTARTTRITGNVSQLEFDVSSRGTSKIRVLPLDSGSVVGRRVTLFVRVPPTVADVESRIMFVGEWSPAGDSIAFTRSGGIAGFRGVFGSAAPDRFVARREGVQSAPAVPIAITPCTSTAPVNGRWATSPRFGTPWVLLLCGDGARLRGFVGMGDFDRPGIAPARFSTCPMANGTMAAESFAFDCVLLPPLANRVVSFRGSVQGDSIVMERTVRSLPGDSFSDQGVISNGGNMRFTVRRTALGAGLGAGPPPITPDSVRFTHAGFTVDITTLGRGSESIVESVRRQIDIADSAIASLSPEQQSWLRSLRVEVRFSALDPSRSPVGHSAGSGTVVMHPMVYDREDPKLLQALMLAYFADRVPGGYMNAGILGLYQQASYGRRFPQGSTLMRSETSYFSMLAALYLRGSAPFEPLTRDRIREIQPDLYAWFVKELGAPRR